MSDTERVETPEVSFSLSGERLTLRDEAGGGEVVVELDGETSLTRATTSWFDVPMDAAVSFETTGLRIPNNTAVWFRDAAGDSRGLPTEQPTTATGGTFVDVAAAMKVVAYVEDGPVRGQIRRGPGADAALVEFDEPTRVTLGARSVHEEPTATMTVLDDPEALATAVSHLGTSIKEWSAERSWPTLRGYPPAIEVGDELQIPDQLPSPDTGVSVAVPDDIADVLRVAPLAHYFGAEVVTGEQPELRLDAGYTEPLGTGRTLERSVDELLARGLVLDSLVRIGGYYSLHRREYDELAPELPFYPPDLYDVPVDEQLLEYLEVPFDAIEPYVPQWSATATLSPAVSEAEALPYLLNVLSRVRVTPDGSPRPDDQSGTSPRLSTATRVPPGVGSISKAARQAGAASRRRAPGEARVVFVGASQPEEGGIADISWEHYEIPDGVAATEYVDSVSRAELWDLFRSAPLFVHYGNPVTPEGFVCSDGVLPFGDLPSANGGVASFQWDTAETAPATGLLDSVAVGCLSRRPLSTAEADGFAKYLVLGYSPLQAAQFVGRAGRVRFLGDASLSVASRADGHPPSILTLEKATNGYRATTVGWMTRHDWLGTVVRDRPDPGESEYTLTGRIVAKRRRHSLDDVLELTTDDHLLDFHVDIPEEVPTESVVHVSRENWGTDASEPSTPHREPFSRS